MKELKEVTCMFYSTATTKEKEWTWRGWSSDVFVLNDKLGIFYYHIRLCPNTHFGFKYKYNSAQLNSCINTLLFHIKYFNSNINTIFQYSHKYIAIFDSNMIQIQCNFFIKIRFKCMSCVLVLVQVYHSGWYFDPKYIIQCVQLKPAI